MTAMAGSAEPCDNEHGDTDPCTGDVPVSMGIWARGGLTVTGLLKEFRDPGWAVRGQYRALKQFIMNWNNWPARADRAAMLDGPPPRDMTRDEKARIAAVVRCLCERDNHPLPGWVRRTRPASKPGVMLISVEPVLRDTPAADAFGRIVMRDTPEAARRYRVWFEAEMLEAR